MKELMQNFKKIFQKYFRLLMANVVRADIPLSFPDEKLLIWTFRMRTVAVGERAKASYGPSDVQKSPLVTAGLVPLHISHLSLFACLQAICTAHGR